MKDDDDDRKGPFDEPISRNSIIPWFDNDVDLNKVGPDPEQVDKAQRSTAKTKRRPSEEAKISLEQKRASSSALVSSNKILTTTITIGGQEGGSGGGTTSWSNDHEPNTFQQSTGI